MFYLKIPVRVYGETEAGGGCPLPLNNKSKENSCIKGIWKSTFCNATNVPQSGAAPSSFTNCGSVESFQEGHSHVTAM